MLNYGCTDLHAPKYTRAGGVYINEELQIQACKDSIEIIEYPFKSSNIKDYIVITVALNEDMTQRKILRLAEKIGHPAPAR
ncbi:MAG: hypothetical protein ACLT8I_16495 [Blautia faecis]